MLMLLAALVVDRRSVRLVSILAFVAAFVETRTRLLPALHTVVLTGAFRWRRTQSSLAFGGFLSVALASETRCVVRLATVFCSVTMPSAALTEGTVARAIVAVVEVVVSVPAGAASVVTLPLTQLRSLVTLQRRSI